MKILVRKLGIVVFWLVEEANETENGELEKEIKEEIKKNFPIPWISKVEKVTVLEEPPA